MTRTRLVVAPALAMLASVALASPALALTFPVDNFGEASDPTINGICDTDVGGTDGTPCTLRAAINEANATGDQDEIKFNETGPHPITSTLLISQPLIIDGNGSGASETVVDGGDAVRLFFTTPTAPVTFKDIRLEDGGLTSGGQQGAAAELNANTTFNNATVTSNQVTGSGSVSGGAIFSPSGLTLTLIDTTVSNNTIGTGGTGSGNAGAGVYVEGSLQMTNSTVSGNMITAGDQRDGAGIYAVGPLSIDRSTIAGNTITGGGNGAGLFASNAAPVRTIANSTISANNAGIGVGGGIRTSASMTLTNNTFAGNSAANGGADLRVEGIPTVTLANTILASSAASSCSENVGGAIQSALPGNNIDVGTSCGFDNTTDGSQESVPLANLALGGLTVNAPGTTATHPLGSTSVALNAGVAAACASAPVNAQDQRGVTRPQGPGCDVGAFELEYRTLTVTPAGTGSGSVGSAPAGISCGGDCSEAVPQGSTVVLTATPATGSSFSAWTDCDSINANQCTQTLGNANETVTATFTLIPRTLTVTKAGSGGGTVTGTGITCGLDCDHTAPHGTVNALTAVPAAGSSFSGWTDCDSAVGNVCTETMDADDSVTASFTADPPAGAGGGAADNSAECAALKKKLKKAKSKKAKKRVRKKLRDLGC